MGRRLVRFLLGEWEEAAAQWQTALDHDLAAGDRHDAVVNARWLADALLALGEERRATEVLHLGLEIAASAPQVPSEVWLRARLAGLATTDPDQAAAHLARCEQVLAAERTGEAWWERWRWPAPPWHCARPTGGQLGWPRSRRSPSSRTTGCRGDRWRHCTRGDEHSPARAGPERPVPGAATPPPCSPGSVPRSDGGRTPRAESRSCAGPQRDLNARDHTRAMTVRHCPRRPGEQRRRGPRSTPWSWVPAAPAPPLAIRLARGGWRVAVVDKARFPSDTLSTHVIFPDGVARLDDLGALKRLERRHDLAPGSLLLAGAGPRGRRLVHAGRRP